MEVGMVARSIVACVVALVIAGPLPARAASSPRQMYDEARAREQAIRGAWQDEGPARPESARPAAQPAATMLTQARAIVAAYEAIVRRYPASGYCDNALWQAAALAADLFARSQQVSDRRMAVRLFEFLAREYPTSSLAPRAADQARRLQSPAPSTAPNPAKSAEPSNAGRETLPDTAPARRATQTPASPGRVAPPRVPPDPAPTAARDAGPTNGATDRPAVPVSTIREIRRSVFAEVVRVSIELDREVVFREERVDKPPRLLFDLPSTKPAPPLRDANWSYQNDIVRHIRVGRHPNQTTRVVLDLDGVSRYTVVTLYNPYRILIDCERAAAPPPTAAAAPPWREAARPDAASLQKTTETPTAKPDVPRPDAAEKAKADASRDEAVASEPPKKPGAARSAGEKEGPAGAADHNRVSMARQLGLGISRIVIDPGHGGRDPGAEGPDVTEARIVLDIALRLEKALAKQPGIEVVLTRRTDVFVPLEERTQIANREQADLFLSIHANASRNQNARGIESYYLNFATNPAAEAVAARENAASERTMNSLADIVKAIALNNKLDESKDLAGLVQQAMARRLRASNKSLKDLGVKQAPFVVLIGAAMPSVLAEVSFVTNRREGQLLATDAYRQRIADALADAIVRYKRGLKTANIVAHQ
jgi:N-acetylmuramoyl-L-alanine amidase